MARSICHHAAGSSTSSKAVANVLRSLASDIETNPLGVSPEQHMDREARLLAVFEVLLNGTDADLSRKDLDYLLHLDVPRALVAGDTRKR